MSKRKLVDQVLDDINCNDNKIKKLNDEDISNLIIDFAKKLNHSNRKKGFNTSCDEIINCIDKLRPQKDRNYILLPKKEYKLKMKESEEIGKKKEFKTIKKDFRENLGKLIKSSSSSLRSINDIRENSKNLENSRIHQILPHRQTCSIKVKKEYNDSIEEGYDKVGDGLRMTKEEVANFLDNYETVYFWADGATASQKKSLMICIGRESRIDDVLNIEWIPYFVGYTSEKDLNLIIPNAFEIFSSINSIKSINITCDNACLNVIKQIKSRHNTRCSFCLSEFYSYLEVPNCSLSCGDICHPSKCDCKVFFKDNKRWCSKNCKCNCKSNTRSYAERKPHVINSKLFDPELLKDFFDNIQDNEHHRLCRCNSCCSTRLVGFNDQHIGNPLLHNNDDSSNIDIDYTGDILHNNKGTFELCLNTEKKSKTFNKTKFTRLIKEEYGVDRLYKGSQIRLCLIEYEKIIIECCSSKKRKVIIHQLFSTLNLINFLLYNKFKPEHNDDVKGLSLLLFAKLNYLLFKHYKFTEGTGLLYPHVLIYHVSQSLIKGVEVSSVNCEQGEKIIGDFKKIVSNYTGSNKMDQLTEFLLRFNIKQSLHKKKENISQKKLMLKKFKDKADGFIKRNSFVKKNVVPKLWLNISKNQHEIREGNCYLKWDILKSLIQYKYNQYNIN